MPEKPGYLPGKQKEEEEEEVGRMLVGKKARVWQRVIVSLCVFAMMFSFITPISAADGSSVPEWAAESVLTVSDITDSSFTVSWPAAYGAESYIVMVSNEAGSVADTVYQTTSNLKYFVNDLAAESSYDVEITAANSEGNSTISLATTVLTESDSTPAVPQWADEADLTVSDITESSFNVSWPAADGAKSYIVMVSNSAGGVADTVYDTTSYLEYFVDGLAAESSYDVEVTASNSAGDSTGSLTTTVVTDSEILMAPFGIEALQAPEWTSGAALTVSNITSDSFDLSWPEAVSAESYHVVVTNTTGGITKTVYDDNTTYLGCIISNLEGSYRYDILVEPTAGSLVGTSLQTLAVTEPPINPNYNASYATFDFESGPPLNGTGIRNVFMPPGDCYGESNFEKFFTYQDKFELGNDRLLWYVEDSFETKNVRVHVNSFRLFNLTDDVEIPLDYGDTNFGTGTSTWTTCDITEQDTGYILGKLMPSGDFCVTQLTNIAKSYDFAQDKSWIRFELDAAKYLEPNKQYAVTIDPQFERGKRNPEYLGKVYHFEFETKSSAPSWDPGAALTVSDLTGTSFNLNWPAASGAESYHVVVSNTTGGETTDKLNTTISDGLSCAVSGLTEGYRYDIRVTAMNSVGDSPSSLESMVVTPTSAAILGMVSTPLNVSLDNQQNFWKFQPNATEDNGRSTDYETVFIYDNAVKPASTNFEWGIQNGFNNSKEVIEGNIESFRLFNLTDEQEIMLDYGDLDTSIASLNSTNPNDWPRPTTITVGDFTVSKVTYCYCVYFVFQPVIKDYLEPDKEYAITIDPQFHKKGLNSLGKVYRFEFSTSTADTTSPQWGTDAQITIGETTTSSVALTWPEASDDTAVANYKIVVSDVNGVVGTIETADNSTSYTVSGLTSNTQYSFTVSALDAARNESAALEAVGSETLPKVPVWPEDATLKADSVMATELIMRWPQVSNTNDLAGYKVYVDGAEEATLPPIQVYYELYGLNSGVKYILSVKPFNALGELGEAIETMVVTPGAGGLTFTFTPTAIDEGEDGYYHNYEIVNPVDMDNFSLAWNFSNGLDKNLRFNLECIHLFEIGTGQEITLDLGVDPYSSTLDGVFYAGDFKYISTGGGTGSGDGTGDGSAAAYKTRMLKFEPGAATLAKMTKGMEYVIEIDPEFTANNGDATLGKIFDFNFITAVDDTESPTWPAGAQLTAKNVGTDSLVLNWPEASDNVGITEYQLYKQGQTLELEQVFGSETTTYKMEALPPDTTYNFVLRARDAKSNYTSDLTLSVSTLLTDPEAPTWPVGSKLTADNVLTDNLDLSWTPADDNVEVTGYRLLKNGSTVADLDAGTFTCHVGQLTPDTSYLFTIEARDKAGNYSTTGPKLAISTLEGEPDTTPPYWTTNGSWSTSTVVGYDNTYPTYHWPWAADNVAVIGYLVYRDGVQIATVDAYTNSYSDVLNADDSYYSYCVYAVDAAGNISEPGHSMSVYSGNSDQDTYSPVWPADTSITLSEFTDNSSVKVKWIPAQDNIAVRGYVVVKDGLWVEWADRGEADTDTRSFANCFVVYNPYINYTHQPSTVYPELISGETYTFSVKAFDTTENSSKGDPKITFVMGTNPTAGAGIPFALTNVDNNRGSLNNVTGALNQVLAAQDPENIKFVWKFEEPLADGYKSKISLSKISLSNIEGDMIALNPADIQYSENEGLLTLDLTGIKLMDTTQYVVKLDKTLAAQSGKQLGFDIAWQFSTDVADKEAPTWKTDAALNISFIKSPTIATLTWPAAQDGVAVTQYQVFQGDTQIAALPGDTLSYEVEGLNLNTAYTFKVVAGDYLENFSYPLTAAATTPAADTTAPEWQDSDVLTFTNITSDHLIVSWPGAADNYLVKTYKLYKDGASEPFAETAGNVLSYVITGLAGETSYNITVKACDFSGNSADLTGNVTTIADLVNPLWPEGSTLQARDIKDSSVTLYWDAATDNVGVTKYNIYCNGEAIQTVDGSTTEAAITGLNGATEYTFEVEAEDLKQNKSVDKLSLIQWTAPNSISTGAAFAFKLEKPLSHNLNYDVNTNTLNNAVDGSFTKNSVAFTFSFAKPLASGTWVDNIELKDSAGNVIPLETSGSISKVNIAVLPIWVSNGDYVLTLKDTLKAADGTLLGRNFTWTFNVPVGPYGVTDIAAGYNSYNPFLPAASRYYLMLKDDGSVWTWGNNDYGTLGDGTTDSREVPTRVETLSNIVALEAGRDSCFALDEDGAVWAWGSNEYGQLGLGTVPSGTSGRYGNNIPQKVVGLPAIEKLHYGFGNVIALDENGKVWIWGFAAKEGISSGSQCSGTPLEVSGLTDIIDVAAGYRIFMAVSSDGDIYSFSRGSTPSKVAGLSEIVAVDAEGIDQRNTTRMALKTDGTAYIWDANSGGPVVSTPTRVEDATQVKAVIADGPYVLGTDGQVTCVDYSAEPALGAPISGLNNVVKLASSANGGLALQTNGTLLQFIGTEVNKVPLNMDPVNVPEWEDSAITITNRAETGLTLNWQTPDPNVSTFAIYQDGKLVTTVSGNTSSYNVLGLTKGQTYTFKLEARFVNSDWSANGPQTSATMTDWNPVMQGAGKLAMSPGHTLMIGDDGSVWAWGQNEFGQLGIGNNVEQLIPVKISGLADITAVAVGDNHSLALDQDGNVWAWGRNNLYQLGNGSTVDSNEPVKIIASGDIKAISAAADHNIVLKNDGTVLGWGGEDDGPPNFYLLSGIDGHTPGQLKYGTNSPALNYTLTGVKGIATSRMFSAYIFDDGRICRIGRFVEPAGSTTWTPMKNYSAPMGISAIAAGENFVVALKEDGTVLTFGDNNFGQYGNGNQGNGTPANPNPYGVVSGLDNVVAVAAGGYHGLALDQDGNVYTWGKNLYGQLGTGKTDIHLTPVKVAGLTDVTDIGGGTESSIAFRNMSKVYVWGRNDNGQLGNDSKVDSKVPTLAFMVGYETDIDAPTWPDYFALIPGDNTATSTTLRWTPAADDIGVTSYEIYVGDFQAGAVDRNTHEYTVDGLELNTPYTFGVKAIDAAGNISVMSKTVTCELDVNPPTWPTDPDLTATGTTADSVTLTWNTADDDIGVAGYEIYVGGSKAESVDGDTTEHTVTGLNADTSYTFGVKAVDAAGNNSVMSNTVDVTTGSADSESDSETEGPKDPPTVGGLTPPELSIQENSANNTELWLEFSKGIADYPDCMSKIEVYKKSDHSAVEYSHHYTKDGSGDNAVKIRRLELHFNNLEAGTTYVVKIQPDFAANNGSTLGQTFKGEFTTEADSVSGGSAISGNETVTIEPVPVLAPGEISLADINGHWAQAAIEQLVGSGAINGYLDSTFKPDNTITRAEFAAILVKAFNLEPKNGKVFNDTANHWAKDYIATTQAYGIINGYDDLTFGPDDVLTREQMAVMIVKAAQLNPAATASIFTDADQISEWAREAVCNSTGNGVMNGYPDGSFRPQVNASRAEAVTVIVNALQ